MKYLMIFDKNIENLVAIMVAISTLFLAYSLGEQTRGMSWEQTAHYVFLAPFEAPTGDPAD